MGLLEISALGCLFATSRWTLTTTLFRAIKRINLSRGSKSCFYTYKRRLAIFMYFKTLDIQHGYLVLYIFSACFITVSIFFFFEDLTVVRI
jgi:hypothetical protein